ncbi:MAG: amino acid ABC transporter substrate-binding protein [Bacillota bacterium]|nr:amino acid ABC transporter substrate-binding protein [Bacillota bacterium]
MKKFLSLTLAAIFVVMVFAGCTSEKTKETSSNKKITSLTVGFDQDFPPYGFVGKDGKFTGFDIEMARALAKNMGAKLVLKPIDWDSKDMELKSGSIDCIWNGFTINGREKDYTWTDAYMNNSQVFVVRANSGIKSFDDLAGKIITVQTDSSAQAALNDKAQAKLLKSFKKLVVCSQYNAAFMDLESGAVDAIAMDIGVAKYQIKDKESKFKILDKSLSSEQYGIGFKLGNTALRDTVQAELMKLVKNGTFAKISKQWFGDDVCILGK